VQASQLFRLWSIAIECVAGGTVFYNSGYVTESLMDQGLDSTMLDALCLRNTWRLICLMPQIGECAVVILSAYELFDVPF